MFLAISLALNIFEKNIPLTFIAPGVKLGLSNIITLILLYVFGIREAAVVMLMRVFISSLFYSGMSSFYYSLAGGLLSLLGMYVAFRYCKFLSIFGISIIGSFLHITAQIIVMIFMLGSIKVALYWYPFLMYASVITGFGVAMVSNAVIERINKILKNT